MEDLSGLVWGSTTSAQKQSAPSGSRPTNGNLPLNSMMMNQQQQQPGSKASAPSSMPQYQQQQPLIGSNKASPMAGGIKPMSVPSSNYTSASPSPQLQQPMLNNMMASGRSSAPPSASSILGINGMPRSSAPQQQFATLGNPQIPSGRNSSSSMAAPASKSNSGSEDIFGGLVSFDSKRAVDMSKVPLAEHSRVRQQSSSATTTPALVSNQQQPKQGQAAPTVKQNVMSPSSAGAWNFDEMISATPPVKLQATGTSSKSNNDSADPLEMFLSGATFNSPTAKDTSVKSSPSVAPPGQHETFSPTNGASDEFAIFSTPARPAAATVSTPASDSVAKAVIDTPQPSLPSRAATPPVVQQPRTQTPSNDETIARLLDIGFDAENAKIAVVATDGSFEAAVEFLLNSPSSRASGSSKNAAASRISQLTGLSQKNVQRASNLLNTASEVGMNIFSQASKSISKAIKATTASSSSNNSNSRNRREEIWDENGQQGMAFGDGSYSDNPQPLPPRSESSLSIHQQAASKMATPPPRKRRMQQPITCSTETQASAEAYKDRGNEAFKIGQYGDAEAFYTQAVECIPQGHLLLITLLNNRAAARLKTGTYKECVADCTIIESMCLAELEFADQGDAGILELKNSLSKALLRRASAFENIEKWEDAAKDYQDAINLNAGAKGAREGLLRCTRATRKPPAHDSSEKSSDITMKPAPAPIEKTPTRNPMDDLNGLAMGFDILGTTANVSNAPSNPGKINYDESERVQEMRVKDEIEKGRDEERLALKDQVDDRINAWKSGKESNIRALIASLDTVLWPEMRADWKTLNMSELVTPKQVKIKYQKVVSKLHPDKLPKDMTVEQELLANAIFSSLGRAWDAFKVQNNIQ